MHPSFLPYLQDPKTGEALSLEVTNKAGSRIVEGWLVSPSNRYPIVRGIPRFAGYNDMGNYTKSFGYQWNKWSLIQFERNNKGRPMEGHTRRHVERITGITSDVNGQCVPT